MRHRRQPFVGATTCEIIYSNAHNASIVLGRDRPGGIASGYGGRGDSHCGSIDIVSGRMGHRARSLVEDDNGESIPVLAAPNFKIDAARIYISQKTDIDKNFRLPKGTMPYATTRSAVALKADGIRLIAREGIKLVAGAEGINSQGGKINTKAHGINLIANNDDSDMQPIPKGENLKLLLGRIVEHLDKLGGVVNSFLISQMTYNLALQLHTHNSPFFGIPVGLAPGLQIAGPQTQIDQFTKVTMGLFNHKLNLIMVRLKYLNPVGDGYINSFYNHTN